MWPTASRVLRPIVLRRPRSRLGVCLWLSNQRPGGATGCEREQDESNRGRKNFAQRLHGIDLALHGDGGMSQSVPSVSEDARALTSGTPSPNCASGWISSAEFVGRDAVLSALCNGGRVCTVIFGEPGIGKTRLLTETRRRAPAETFSVSCVPLSNPIPFDPLIALTRMLIKAGRLPPSTLDALLDSSEADRLLYFRDALSNAAANAPFCIQLDDIHAADEKTLEAIRYCATRLCDLSINWQLTARRTNPAAIDLASALERSELARVINLPGLTCADLKVLSSRLRPDASFSDDDIAELHRRTGGNPLYAELLLVAPMLSDGAASSDLRRALDQRLAGLSANAFGVASWLAVSIDGLTATELSVLKHVSFGRINRALADLTNESIVQESEGRYQIRHDLLREVCYAMIDEKQRVEMHAGLANRCTNDWRRAAHFDGAQRYHDAAVLYNSIGWNCLERCAPHEALKAFECTLERSGASEPVAIEAKAGKASALVALGQTIEAKSAMDWCESCIGSLSPSARVKSRMVYAETTWESTDDDTTILPFVQEAFQEARAAAPEYLPRLYYLLGSVEERRGNLEQAKEILLHGIKLCREPGDRSCRIRLQAWLGVVLARQGHVQESLDHLESLAANTAAWNLSNELAQCCAILCYVSHMAGDKTRYEHWCRTGLEAAGPKSKVVEANLRAKLAGVAIDRGNLHEALGLILTAEDSVATNKLALRCRLLCLQIQLYAMLGDFESVARVIDSSPRYNLPPAAMRAVSFSCGFAAELREDFEEALAQYAAATAGLAADEFGEMYHVRALSGLVRMAAMQGRDEQANISLDLLRLVASRGWPLAQRSLREAEGHLTILRGQPEGCAELLQAARECEYPFWRAHLQLVVANATGDRDLFLDSIQLFDNMGAEFAADRGRALARSHGLRPGRKREAQGGLSSRETSVAFLIASGKTNAEIGELLHITSRTVEYHVGNILSKCALRSRVDIVRMLAAGRPLELQAQL